MTMARVSKGIISTYEGKKEAEDDESVVSDVNENLTPTKKHLRKKTPAQNQEVKYKSVIAVEKELRHTEIILPLPRTSLSFCGGKVAKIFFPDCQFLLVIF